MHVNHAKEFLKSVHSEALFSQLFDQAFTPLCKEPGILTSKLFDLMSLFGQDLPKNHLADYICDNCAASNIQSAMAGTISTQLHAMSNKTNL